MWRKMIAILAFVVLVPPEMIEKRLTMSFVLVGSFELGKSLTDKIIQADKSPKRWLKVEWSHELPLNLQKQSMLSFCV